MQRPRPQSLCWFAGSVPPWTSTQAQRCAQAAGGRFWQQCQWIRGTYLTSLTCPPASWGGWRVLHSGIRYAGMWWGGAEQHTVLKAQQWSAT